MDELLYETRDGIGFVTLNRPQARNALTFPMYEKLRQIALAAGDDRSLRAIVITGAGGEGLRRRHRHLPIHRIPHARRCAGL